MAILVTTPHFVVTRESGREIVRVTRTDVPFASLDELETTFQPLQLALDGIGRKRHALLIDTRAAPLRTDPEFERAFEPHRVRLLSGFARVAVLVRSAVGKLQVQRHSRDDGLAVAVFDDEAEAEAWLAGVHPRARS